MALAQAVFDDRVNARRFLRVLPFTLAALIFLAATPARADRVVLLRPSGPAPVAQRTVVESSLRSALESLSYDVVLDSEQGGGDDSFAPTDANDFRAIAEIGHAEFALAPAVVFVDGGYRLTLGVGYAPRTRLESLTFEVRAAREHDRLVEVLRAVLRPEGMGDAATRFAGPDPRAAEAEAREREAQEARDAEEAARAAAEEEARRQSEADSAAEAERQAEEARAAEERAASEAEAAAAEEQREWENRERYGAPERMSVYGNFGVSGILNATPGARGGAFYTLGGRFGRSIASVPGLELRAGLDFAFGATGGMSISGGAVYLASPFRSTPLHFGGGLELGYHQAFTGNRAPQMLIRAEALMNWHATENVWLEAAFPAFTVYTANGGVVTLGFELRAGTRF